MVVVVKEDEDGVREGKEKEKVEGVANKFKMGRKNLGFNLL